MVLFKGLDVILHVPVIQPTYFQYKKPPMPPAIAPIKYKMFLRKNVAIVLILKKLLFLFTCANSERDIERTNSNKGCQHKNT